MAVPRPYGDGGPWAGGTAEGTGGSNLPPYRMTLEERAMFQYSTDYFDEYWKGLQPLERLLAENNAGTRHAIYHSIQVPRQRTQPRFADSRPAGPSLNTTVQRAKYLATVERQFSGFVKAINLGAYDILQRTKPLGLELKQVLGKGGFGIACLFELTDTSGARSNVVVKISTGTDDISRELAHMDRTAGANHIVQRIYFRDLPGAQVGRVRDGYGAVPGSTSPAEIARLSDNRANMVAMEYMRNGDIYHLLNKTGGFRTMIKDQDLWQVFHCLFRGVLGLAYPQFYAGGKNPAFEAVTQQYETIVRRDGQPLATDKGIVHFDLEIQNTMIGDLDAQHGAVPIVKIGDLGCGELLTPESRDDFNLMMKLRVRGKYDSLVPEQTTRDWDYVDRAPKRLGERVAGNYDWWTNLYQAAHIMWKMITGFGPDMPPEIARASFTNPNGVPLDFWTYGAILLQQIPETVNHDPDLLATVAWCMAASPDERPKMDELEAILLYKCNPAQWLTPELGSNLKGSIMEILNAPPAPPANATMATPAGLGPYGFLRTNSIL